jgi:hypothetical protein
MFEKLTKGKRNKNDIPQSRKNESGHTKNADRKIKQREK